MKTRLIGTMQQTGLCQSKLKLVGKNALRTERPLRTECPLRTEHPVPLPVKTPKLIGWSQEFANESLQDWLVRGINHCH